MAASHTSFSTRATRMVQVLAAVALVAGSLWYWSPQQASSAPGDGFEITDANIIDSPAGAPYDWSALFDANGASTGVSGFVATSFVADPLSGDPLASPPCLPDKKGDPTVFTSGGSDKNGDAINTWTYESGSVPNSKDDLSNLYAAARQEPNSTGGNDTVIYFGLERSDSNGSAHMDFEFLQNPIGLQATGTDSSGCPSGHFVGTRTVGDILLVMDFDNGGTVGDPQVLTWNGTTYEPAVLAAGTVGLFENGAPIACGPWGCRDSQGNHVTTLPTNAFVEGYLNISQLFGTTTPACYSSFDSKTRSSSSWSSELKDFAFGAFDTCDARISITPSGVNQVGSNHQFTVHVDANATGTFTPKAGVQVTGTISGVGSFVGPNTCTTDASGNCTLTITSATAGTSTVNASATIEVIPGHSVFRSTATNPGTGGSGPATKNWVDAYVKVTPNDVNAVNDPHTFTVEYGVLTGGATGLTIDTPTITPTVTPSGYTGYSDTCASPTQLAGQNVWQCTVTINSTVATVYTANATATTTVHMVGGTPASVALPRSTTGVAGPGGNTGATKTYVDARISISPDGLNQVDDPTTPAIEDAHTITATVETKDGNGSWVKAPAGTPVTFALSGVGAFVGGTNTCNTIGTTGQCTVQINSLVYGTSSVSASASLSVHGVALTRATNTAVNTAAGGSGDVTKKWVDASITVVETAVNEVGDQHQFTITVTPLVPTGASVTNVAITPSVDPSTTVVGTTCGSNVALVNGVATCTYTINSAVAGVFNVDAATTVDFAWGSFTQSVSRSTTGYAGPSGNQGATKTYVDARVSLTPDGVNAVGNPHTITGHAEYNDGTGWKDAAGKTITFTLTNEGGATATFVGGNSTCVTGANGQCTVQIVSSTPGVSYVSASTSYAVLGVTLNRTSATDVHDPANVRKEWVAAHITITPNDVNEVRNSHTFTINVDAESSGAAISIGTIGATVVPDPDSKTLSCGDQTATATGATRSCTLVINSNDPGVFTANASVTVTIGGVTFNLTTNGQNGNSGPATKTYVDARVTLTPDGVNEVNHPHPVTAFVEINDGTHGWVPAGAGVVVGLTESGPGSIAASCTTAANGKCTTNLTSSAAGVSTVHASATVTVLGQTFTRETSTVLNTYAGGGNDLTKRWVDAVISITPNGVNPVGAPHQFTITVVAIPSGAGTPAFAITPSVTPAPDSLLSSCATPTISADGNTATCTVTITDNQPGVFTANATATISVGGVTMIRSTDPASIYGHGPGGSGPATKTYVTANIEITADGINEVGQPHTVTGHVTVDNGTGSANAPDGTVIQFTIASGPGTLSAPSCTTAGGTGACSVTLTSASVGTTSVHASSIVTVNGVTFQLDTNGPAGTNSDNLRKDWVDGYVKVTPDAVNEVNTPHTFTVEYGVLAPAGTTVTLGSLTADVVPNPNTQESSTCGSPVRTGNVWTCQVTVNSSVTGVFDIDAAGSATVTDPLIPGVTRTVTRSTTGTSGPGGNSGATKTYVDARISLAPGGLNEVDHPHAITATVETKDGNGAWTPAPAGTSVAFNLSGAGGFVGGISQCTTLGTTGQCELSIISASAGVSTVGATSTVTVHGVSITRQTNTAVNTAAGGSGNVVKHWVDGSIRLVESAFNEVNHAHVFTITAQAHVASADETVVFNSITPSVSPTPDLPTSTTCGSPTIAADGLSATCTYTVNSTTAGVFDADATVVMTIDNALYPAVQLTRSTAPGGDPGPSGNTGATKTFVDARVTVGADGVNAVGTPHTVTGTAEFNDGTGWKPATGQTITFAITSGPGSLSATTCTANAAGTCSVTLTSSQTGVTWVSASTSYAVQGVTLNRTTAVTGATDPNNLRKEWVEAAITITPSAVNEVNHAHVFDINVTASSSGAAITIGTVGYTVTPTPDAATLSCGTQQGTSGTATRSCTLTINDSTAGVYTAHATAPVDIDGVHFDLATNGQAPNSGPAAKTYVDARLSLSPNGINEVGTPHTVTALVEVNDGTHGWQPAPAGTIVNLTETGPGAIPATCTTGASGTCTAQLTSTTVGVSTVHGAVTVTVLGVPVTRETSTPVNTAAGGSSDLTKRWIDGSITIGPPTAQNDVNQPHVFTVTVTAVPSGGSPVSFDSITTTVSPAPTAMSSTCANPAIDGNTATCTLTINSSVEATYTANATAKISVGGTTILRSTDAAVATAGPEGSGPATKVYVAPIVVLGEVLTKTGFELAPWIGLAAGLVLMGGAMVLATRRRRASGS